MDEVDQTKITHRNDGKQKKKDLNFNLKEIKHTLKIIENAVTIENASFSWSENQDETTLKKCVIRKKSVILKAFCQVTKSFKIRNLLI